MNKALIIKKYEFKERRLPEEALAKAGRTLGINSSFMYYISLIQSIKSKPMYVGYTVDIQQRLATHNSGGSIHTKKR